MCTPSFMQVRFQSKVPGCRPRTRGLKFREPMRRSPVDELRLAVEMLPERTRSAMLAGIRSNDIIVGAYTDRKGGVCPMLAAHRCGGRTDFLAFAHAWDRFTDAKRPRLATPREVKTLVSYLRASLAEGDGLTADDLAGAIADHQ